jgi:hypothetical protein
MSQSPMSEGAGRNVVGQISIGALFDIRIGLLRSVYAGIRQEYPAGLGFFPRGSISLRAICGGQNRFGRERIIVGTAGMDRLT